MTDFVISEEQLSAIEMGLKMGGITVKRNVLLTEIRSRPLSDELESAYKNGFNDGQAEGMSTPCEEQGCTDIENCDEICLHTRIYSPAQFVMQCDIIRKAERERVLDAILEWWHREGWYRGFDATYKFMKSLREVKA